MTTIFYVQWVMPSSIRDALTSWWGVFIGKKRKKVWKAVPLCLFWTLWKEGNRRAFEDFELTDHAILRSLMYMFLEWSGYIFFIYISGTNKCINRKTKKG